MKKIFKLIVTCCLCLTAVFAGCAPETGGNNPGGGNPNGTVDMTNLSGKLDVLIFNGGYGLDWIKKFEKSFEAVYPDVNVSIKETVSNDEVTATLQSKTQTNDLVLFQTGSGFTFGPQGKVADITDVFNTVPNGETKKIGEKLESVYKTYFNQGTEAEPKYYQMPWGDSKTGLVYNKTVLDQLFGADGWTEPRTTNELIALSDRIKGAGAYAFSFTTSQPYWDYLMYDWWAQYQGYDEFMDFYNGNYLDENGEKKFTTENMEVCDQKGRASSLNLLYKLIKESNGYCHPNSDEMDYMEAQAAFLSEGYYEDKKLVAMMANGVWLENEMTKYLERNPQDIRFMKTPVISDIIERCPTIPDETTLCKVIDYIDGVSGSALPDSVSQADYNRILEARKLVHNISSITVSMIPINSDQIPLAKAFLVYMCSDLAQEMYAQSLNGLTMPYGYDISKSSTILVTPFQKSVIDSYGLDSIAVFPNGSTRLSALGGFSAFNVGTPSIYTDFFVGSTTPSAVLSGAKNFFKNNWSNILYRAGISG